MKKASDAVIEHVATALMEHEKRELLRRVGKETFDCETFKKFFGGLVEESERALGVLSFSYIDTIMIDLMSRFMNDEIKDGVSSLFDPFAPLNSASSRIKMCAALWWINKTTNQDLDILRKIRNEFAHNPHLHSFENTKIKDLMSSLGKSEKTIIPIVQYNEKLSNRDLYYIRSILVCAKVTCDLLMLPHASRSRLPAPMILNVPFDDQPENIKNVLRAASEVIVQFLETKKSSETVPK